MHKKIRNALVVFAFMAVAFGVVFSFDYTDTYVGDRFTKAVANRQYTEGDPFSLDAFLEYYDWDKVCVTVPYSTHDYKNMLGRPYRHVALDDTTWSLVFVKEGYVVAEIPISRKFIEYPPDIVEPCFDRWSAIIRLDQNNSDDGADLRMVFVGN